MDLIVIGIILFVLLATGIPVGLMLLGRKGVVGSGWKLDDYSKNMKLEFPKDCLWSFKFPTGYPGVHKIYKGVQGIKGKKITITYSIVGKNPVFEAAGDTPLVSLLIGDGGIYSHDGYRNPLEIGPMQTLSVPLTPDCWGTINGYPCNYDDAHKREFENSVAKASNIGVIFGDTHGLAHGADLVSGSAEFRLISLQIS